jgi:Kyakuja-Dileera-Zisupton transposase
MYDIACTLKPYLRARMDKTQFERLTFAVSIFHCYGHELSCQVLYSPRRLAGAGLTDGEACEWNWSRARYCILDMSTNLKGISYQLCEVLHGILGGNSFQLAL